MSSVVVWVTAQGCEYIGTARVSVFASLPELAARRAGARALGVDEADVQVTVHERDLYVAKIVPRTAEPAETNSNLTLDGEPSSAPAKEGA